VIVRYNRRANPEPGELHPQFAARSGLDGRADRDPRLHRRLLAAGAVQAAGNPRGDITIKATGYQWYWGYEYPDHEFAFESFMLTREEDLAEYGYAEDDYLLATDTAMVVPVGKTVVVQVTAADVIHSWTIPAFGVKQDAVPGRLAELWFEAEKEGVYFGQCSELCGKDHAYMPITVKVVSQEAYDAWLDGARRIRGQAARRDGRLGRLIPSLRAGDRPRAATANRPAARPPGDDMSDASLNSTTHTAPITGEASFGDYFALLKPRVMSLVVFTALVGLLCRARWRAPDVGFAAILFIAVGGGRLGRAQHVVGRRYRRGDAAHRKRPIPRARSPGRGAGLRPGAVGLSV
jgi:cytochrome c oxidase subunit II